MSVDIKTPTRTPFDHPEFPCCNKTVIKSDVEMPPTDSEVPVFEEVKSLTATDFGEADGASQWRSSGRLSATKRKRFSEKSSSSLIPFKKRFGRHGKEKVNAGKIILPTKFLLGGNITDPLNLNSMCDEEINRALNERTPQSSPLPMPIRRHQVQVFIPPNINDPLNLNNSEDVDLDLISPKGTMKKRRNKHKRKRFGVADTIEESCAETGSIDSKIKDIIEQAISQGTVPKSVTCRAMSTAELQSRDINKIVSPVIPQTSPKRKRKRTSSEHKSDTESTFSRQESEKSNKSDKSYSPYRPRFRKQLSMGVKHDRRPHPKDHLFTYGNYTRYYGYRNPNFDQDRRLKCLNQDWFEGKDVLDIGCNVGHVTLSIARFLNPRRIVGMDIDGKLIHAAKKNIRYYLSSQDDVEVGKFPISNPVTFGPITAPPVCESTENPGFPHNIMFNEANYVLETDEQLEAEKEEYNIILALSITKWIHLNWGDAGLKRFFKRIFRQLRPGGRLVLEPQAWPSYKRKKNLTETIEHNFNAIKFRPDQFTEYLLSREVGFSTCQTLDAPFNKSKGFRRPIQVFTKSIYGSLRMMTPLLCDLPHSSTSTPKTDRESLKWPTPAFSVDCDSSCATTPKFEIGSGGGLTPCSSVTCSSATGTPYQAWSANVTDSDSAMQSCCADSASNTPLHGLSFSVEPVDADANCSPDTRAREDDCVDEQQCPSGEEPASEHGTKTEKSHAD